MDYFLSFIWFFEVFDVLNDIVQLLGIVGLVIGGIFLRLCKRWIVGVDLLVGIHHERIVHIGSGIGHLQMFLKN